MKSSAPENRIIEVAQKKIVDLRRRIARLDQANAQLAQHMADQVTHSATGKEFHDPAPPVVSAAQGPYGVAQDIVAAQQTEHQLRSLTEQLDQAFRTAPLATIEIDTRGIIRRWNPVAEQLFGWSAAEAVGRDALSLIVPGIAVEYVQVILKAMAYGHIFSRQNGSRTKDGRPITCQWYNTLLYDDQGQVLGALLQAKETATEVQPESETGLCQAVGDNVVHLPHVLPVNATRRHSSWR